MFDFVPLVDEAFKLPLTKRNILRIGAKFFDPMGLISPVVMVAKIYFQKVCVDKVQWDDVLPEEIAVGWTKYLHQLAEIKSICIPRYVFYDLNATVTTVDLHGFCDSSNQAYCAVVYAVNESGVSRIVTSKAKVAPIKVVSIPRLKLLSCVLLAEIMEKICGLLKDVKISKKYMWSDSEVALAWIKVKDKVRESWVQNRVNKIKEICDVNSWNYVNTSLNPADIGTREASELKFAGGMVHHF